MAAADTPVERTMFVRKATGLVKGWSVFDAFIYSAFAINLMALGFGYAFTGIAVFPTGGADRRDRPLGPVHRLRGASPTRR